MLCQSCGQRPATIKIKKTVDGHPHELNLCHQCYQERAFFEGAPSLFQQFFGQDPFFGANKTLGRSYRPRQEINIADFFTEKSKAVINDAVMFSGEKGSKLVDTEHLLYGIASEEEAGEPALAKLNIKADDLKSYLEENSPEQGEEIEEEQMRSVDFTPRAKRAIELAFQKAREMQMNYVGPEHLLLGLALEGEGLAAQTLLKYKATPEKIERLIPRSGSRQPAAGKKKAQSKTPNLDKYSRDLTVMAKDGKLDPVIGRSDEVARVIQILSRRTKNNPVLIGEPGVGKTAIAEGLALKIAGGNVPELVKDKRVVALDIPSMVAGTKFRGEFEKRLKKCLEEMDKANKNIILFVDELHTIVGAGGAEGAIDASNILKPALARGELQMIGATTLNEYKKHVEKDAALERRFQPVLVDEPTVEDTIKILRGLRDRYEAHHKTVISDEAIVAAASLSDRYIKDRFLPDKAIDLVDEAASKVCIESFSPPKKLREVEKKITELEKEKSAEKDKKKTANLNAKLKKLKDEKKDLDGTWRKDRASGRPTVFASDIEKLLSDWTGIPVSELAEEEVEKLMKLEGRLHERVINQKEAVKAVAEAVRRGRAGLKDPDRPIGSFIFLGPTGVGKTELAKALAALMFGDEDAMIRLDMSEYMEKHTVSRLIGSPPGYVGHEEGGQLTEKVRRKPYSVILLDEIEKAHPDVFNSLLQILEDGRLTDGKGRTVDFKNTIIIATSNIGSEKIQRATEDENLGFGKGSKRKQKEELKQELMDELKQTFRPEFLNRVDEVIIFEALGKKELGQIVELMLDEVNRLLQGQNIKMKVSKKAKDKLIKDGYDPVFGARPLRRTIQKQIETPLSGMLLEGKFKSGYTIQVDLKGKEFSFTKAKSRKRKKVAVAA